MLSNDILPGQPQAPVTLLGVADIPSKQWLWQACAGGREQSRHWQGQRSPSQTSPSSLPWQEINGNRVHQQPVCQVLGMQVTITTPVLSLAALQDQPWLLELLSVSCRPQAGGLQVLSLHTPHSRHLNLTLLEASMNFTPLYVMDSIMVGIFFICSVDFFRNKNIQATVVNKSSLFHHCPTKAGLGHLGAGGGKPALGGSRG